MTSIKNLSLAALLCAALLIATVPAVAQLDAPFPPEDELIAVLESADATWHDKQSACRALRHIGTAKSVPALAALLPDPELSNLARFALEPMSNEAAGAALREGLEQTEGVLQIGVISSLGARRDPQATPLLIPLMKSEDEWTASAAAAALGRIATPEAVRKLHSYAQEAPEAHQVPVAEGLLRAGEEWLDQGKGDEAARVYKDLLAPKWPQHIRMGAFRGLAHAQPDQAPDLILRALRGDDMMFRELAAQVATETADEAAAKRYVDALPGLPLEGKLALMRALPDLPREQAAPAALDMLKEESQELQLAALAALASLGGAAETPVLIETLASQDRAIVDAAAAALVALQDDQADDAIAQAAQSGDPQVAAQLLQVLVLRGSRQTLPAAQARLNDPNVEMRVAALEALGAVGSEAELKTALERVQQGDTGAEQTAAARAMADISGRAGEQAVPALLEALKAEDAATREAALGALNRAGGEKALEAVAQVAQRKDDALRQDALRMLSNWESPNALPHLKSLMQGDEPEVRRLALRGYVRFAGEAEQVDRQIEMLNEAMEAAQAPQEKWIVLSGWGSVASPRAFEALRPYLDDEAVSNEAASAMITVAQKLAEQGQGQEAKQALQTVIDTVETGAVRNRAQQVLDNIGQ